MSFPLKPPQSENIELLGAIVRRTNSEELMQLQLRLKKLRSEAFKRATSWRAVSAEYAKNCECCKGTGQFHYCINPYCNSKHEVEQDDCVHFTPSELEIYNIIHAEYALLLVEAISILKTGVSVESILGDRPKCPSEMN